MNARGYPLGQADPFEGRVHVRQQLGPARIVAVGNAAADSLDVAVVPSIAAFVSFVMTTTRKLGKREVSRTVQSAGISVNDAQTNDSDFCGHLSDLQRRASIRNRAQARDRQTHNLKVTGSNPVPATNRIKPLHQAHAAALCF